MTEANLPKAALWDAVFAERKALAADLAGLDEEAWRTPSLCEGLSVRELLAHLTAGASLSWPRWMLGVIKCRFDFDAQVDVQLRRRLGRSGAETLAAFEGVATSTTRPIPLKAMLGDIVVHGEDIRRPLGIRREHPVATVTAVAAYFQRTNLAVPSAKRAAGLRLEATDGPFRAGSGPLAAGPTIALVGAMTGRAVYCDELDGAGVPVLRERCESR
ncbi:maleylpyruvate isomerase family mycothiol-dependent enzyme [Glycomyces terrestris]|uniref:maleylpyruvate isomerase family mycothiol-dependent enzyme n=1 Tax=Glycomyces terrestris TaxID=2493553 RepID=UPI001E4FEADA|nr:maleylpyruvate isomerase family mycothiol-dependent enzyme [Glycomyces terrestris]